MVQIVVSRVKQAITTADGLKMRVYLTAVRNEEKLCELRDYVSSGDVGTVCLAVRRRFWMRRLETNSSVIAGIGEFLNRYHAKQIMIFDCHAFANMLCGVKSHRVEFSKRYWNFSPYRIWPKVGSVIFLLRDKAHFCHAAVYIGAGLYLSVYGAGGDLEISSLRDMKNDFGARHVVRATPRIAGAQKP